MCRHPRGGSGAWNTSAFFRTSRVFGQSAARGSGGKPPDGSCSAQPPRYSASDMRIYVVRHGKAEDDGYRFDEDRPLTDEGRALMRRTAKAWVKAKEKEPELWLSSPLVRAVQTCEICVNAFEQEGPVEVTRAIVPEGQVSTIVERLDAIGAGSVALVSHEPFVSDLASFLLGRPFPSDFKKGAVLALKRGAAGEDAELLWFLEPAKHDKEPKFRDRL